ncbi:MAG TPA: SOS response-associated peptidase [Longimicrobiales bacterium]
MCGRYTFTLTQDELERTFDIEVPFPVQPRYNIAPTQQVLALVLEDGAPRARLLRWGLVPHWAEDVRIGNRMINARSESVASKPAFRNAFQRRRCLILADGWYEWKRGRGAKVPYWIHRRDRRPFAFAGLWEIWRGDPAAPLLSCTILTAPAAPEIRSIYDRMPVVLTPDQGTRWLDPAATPAALAELFHPDGTALEAHAVSPLVNAPVNDLPECIEPAAPDGDADA